MDSVYRLAITLSGITDVQGADVKQALAIAEQALKRGGLTLASRPVLNVAATVTPLIRIDNSMLKENAPRVVVNPAPRPEHKLEPQDITIEINEHKVH